MNGKKPVVSCLLANGKNSALSNGSRRGNVMSKFLVLVVVPFLFHLIFRFKFRTCGFLVSIARAVAVKCPTAWSLIIFSKFYYIHSQVTYGPIIYFIVFSYPTLINPKRNRKVSIWKLYLHTNCAVYVSHEITLTFHYRLILISIKLFICIIFKLSSCKVVF